MYLNLVWQEVADKKAAQDAAKEAAAARDIVDVVEDCKVKAKTSDVWDFFDFPKLYNGSKKAKCKICEKLISAVNTTNLRSHMNSVHKQEVTNSLIDNDNVSTVFSPTEIQPARCNYFALTVCFASGTRWHGQPRTTRSPQARPRNSTKA
jgi:hypothetical protein